GGVTPLRNDNYVVVRRNWNSRRGAVTWANGNTGITGIVSDVNSLVGTSVGDAVGALGVTALSNGNYLVSSMFWNGNSGAVTCGNGNTGITGTVSDSNANDLVGGYIGIIGNGHIPGYTAYIASNV